MFSTSRHSAFRATASALLLAAAFTVGCNDDATSPPKVVTQNAVIPANAAVVAAIANTTFSFPGGGGAISPAVAGQNLALSFGGTASSPTASLTFTTSAGAQTGQVSASVRFGSCIFTVTQSSFPTGHPLAVGQSVTVNPCSYTVNTAGQQANGTARSTTATLQLGTTQSAPVPTNVSVASSGQVSVNGQPVGNVPVTNATG